MTEKLKDFAALIKKANEEKAAKEAAELERKKESVGPLLSELFDTVKEAKKVKEASKPIGKETVVELVKTLESQLEEAVADVQEKLEKTANETDAIANDSVKKLKDELEVLRRQLQMIERDVKSIPTMISGVGSGEVQITRMDDVVGNPMDGQTLVWSSSKRKFIYQTPGSSTSEEEMLYSKRIDTVSDELLYKGEAAPGTAEGSPSWRIRKILINAEGDVTETWANGSSDFLCRWTDRSSYTYS